MGHYSRTINGGRPRREFERKLKGLIEEGFFKKFPQEKIENDFGNYTSENITLVVRYESYEPTEADLFTYLDKKDVRMSKLLNLIGMEK